MIVIPGFVLIPKVERVANPRIERLCAGDERIVFDVLLVETDVRLGHLGDFDVGAGQFLSEELDFFLDGGGRALDVHLGDRRRNAAARHGHRQMASALDWTMHPAGFFDVHLGRVDAARLGGERGESQIIYTHIRVRACVTNTSLAFNFDLLIAWLIALVL